MSNPDDLLRVLVSKYGHLCSLVAQVLTEGHDTDAVVAAAHGKGDHTDAAYEGIRCQRIVTVRALRAAVEGHVPQADIRAAVSRARQAIEGEWMMALPLFAETVNA